MERRKPRRSYKCNDELALVKAAAWAWFQHGSGSDGNPNVREFDIRRTCHGPYKPSRYKLEDIDQMATNVSDKERMDQFEGLKLKPPSAVVESKLDYSLLDTYEIESISQKLDQLIESSGDDKDKIYKGFLFRDILKVKRGGRRSESNLECRDKFSLKLQETNLVGHLCRQESVQLLKGNTSERKKHSKIVPRGFWHIHAAICGRSEDVLNTSAFVVSHRRPENGIRTGGERGCLPRKSCDRLVWSLALLCNCLQLAQPNCSNRFYFVGNVIQKAAHISTTILKDLSTRDENSKV